MTGNRKWVDVFSPGLAISYFLRHVLYSRTQVRVGRLTEEREYKASVQWFPSLHVLFVFYDLFVQEGELAVQATKHGAVIKLA